MASYISNDFKPDPDTINKLRVKGIFEDFLGESVTPEFLIYWEDQRKKKLQTGKKASWQRTFYTWAIRAFEGKAGRLWEENRHIRERYSTGLKGDLFGDFLEHTKREGDRVVATTAQMRREPPLDGKLDQVRGGRECAGMESSNSISSRSANRCLPIPPEYKDMKSAEDVFDELRAKGILR